MVKSLIRAAIVSGLTLVATTGAQAASKELKPFILGYETTGNMTKVADQVKDKLKSAGFDVAGSYEPYKGAMVIAVTNQQPKEGAAKSKFGGYGAAQRVTLTEVNGQIQVSYTNPVYMEDAYRMNANYAPVLKELKSALGDKEAYGPKNGLTASKLRKYHYMFGMEYFTDPSHLAEYDNYKDAVAAVEKGLAGGKGGAHKVYRIEIPGQDQTVFGVALTKGCSGDKYIMHNIDFKPIRSTPHLPYEVLVNGKNVYALYARFRIAINFPDLAMMGHHSFVNIMCAPGAIEKSLTEAAGGKI